jgi:16S rRNA G966 N2-methylase RsmD
VEVWFDSGCTHAFVLEKREDLQWPASMYLEGSDQHRGWFHSSLLESCGTRGRAPYESILSHGFVVDGKGLKMSKSLGNVIAPEDILKNIWPYEKKNLMSYSLNKLSSKKIESYLGILVRIDMQSKNVLEGNIWDSIYDLSISVAKNKLSVIAPVDIIGRAKKQKVILNKDFVMESLTVEGTTYSYQQVENSFTQPNAKVNEKMLSWAKQATMDTGGDLIELYCGNGNFSIALAQNFDRVLGTEISKTSVKSAQINITTNNMTNIDIVRMSSEEFSQAMNGERKFRRLEGFDLTAYNYDTVLVDPPRAGLDPDSVELVSRFKRIIYVSCSPETLKDNLTELCKTHTIEKFALFDQFPYTDHIETGVILTRK